VSAHFDTSAWSSGLPWSAGAVVLVLVGTFAVAKIAGKHSVIDTAWGLLFCAVAITTFVHSNGHGDGSRRVLLLVLPVLWGLRLAQHIGRRTIGRPEDQRYEELLSKARGNPDLYALRMVYLLQGVLAFVIAAPILVGAYETCPLGILAWIGVAAWLVGVFFEAVGDAQMERFRSDPANKGRLIQSGLWRYTRHPNYFGDACVWWGLSLIAFTAWPGVLTLLSPLLMTWLLAKGTGKPLLEKDMASRRPGYAEYVRRTSGFVPLPPTKQPTAPTRGDPA
jgi:steroid 5-alpha reductase family enzyme